MRSLPPVVSAPYRKLPVRAVCAVQGATPPHAVGVDVGVMVGVQVGVLVAGVPVAVAVGVAEVQDGNLKLPIRVFQATEAVVE